MLVLTHIIVALSSLIFTGAACFNPTQAKLNASYFLVAGTLVSGTALVVASHSGLLGACTAGLVYLVAAFGLIAVARTKLAVQKTD